MSSIKSILKHFKDYSFQDQIFRGIEREALRVNKQGKISTRPHPQELGSALTHPTITTDFSEALMEFVTPVFNDPKKLLEFLKNTMSFTLKNLNDEILWNNSMPCFLNKDTSIPLADYGSSNIGKMKKVYRKGLSKRYGSMMQTISGIHFNFSLSDDFFLKLKQIQNEKISLKDFKSNSYMSCTRNIHKYSWLIPFFMGSSPVICKSFLNNPFNKYCLKPFDSKGTLTFDGATSLRLSNIGYTNSSQDNIHIDYNNLTNYISGLRHFITTEDSNFKKIGLKKDGQFSQLNTNILQLENEYYAEVRPKRTASSLQSPSLSLNKNGIEYIELRSVDINTFSPLGIELDQIMFLDVFLITCLLKKNLGQSKENAILFRKNQEKVARYGRSKNLTLFNGHKNLKAVEVVEEFFELLFLVAEKLDQEKEGHQYSLVITKYFNCIQNTEQLLSEQLLITLQDNDQCFFENTLIRSQKFSQDLKEMPLDKSFIEQQELISKKSIEDQKEIEKNDSISFDDFLSDYFKQNNLKI